MKQRSTNFDQKNQKSQNDTEYGIIKKKKKEFFTSQEALFGPINYK